MFILSTFQIDVIVDLGAATFQVGTLRRSGSGNPVEAILNSQSKRQSPTIVAFDGYEFHVGEYGAAYQKKNPGPIFRSFVNSLTEPVQNFAVDKNAEQVKQLGSYQGVLLVSALMNHIVKNMVGKEEKVDITLIHPPSWTLTQLNSFKKAVDQIAGTTLYNTVPTPNAVVITHISSRMKDLKEFTHQYVVTDIGASTTEISIVEASSTNGKDVTAKLIANTDIKKGGDDITQCLIQKHVSSKLPNLSENLKLQKRVFDNVEKAKISLTGNTVVKLTIESGHDGKDIKMELTRQNVDDCVDELFSEQIAEKVKETQKLLGNNTQFLFYGGSSRVPHFQAKFEQIFNTSFLKTVNLDEGAIFGGAMVAARTVPSFKMATKFTSVDNTRPFLMLGSEQIIQLNPLAKQKQAIPYPLVNKKFELTTEPIVLNVVTETSKYEADETGEKKKKTSQSINSDTIEVQKFSEIFETVNYIAQTPEKETLFVYSCNLSFKEYKKTEIMRKYGQKNNAYAGMIKQQHFDDAKKEAEEHSKQTKSLADFLTKYQKDKSIRENFQIFLNTTFSTDSSAAPNMTTAVFTIIPKEKQTAIKKKDLPELENDLEHQCQLVYNPKFALNDSAFKESYEVVINSNLVAAKRVEYENSINQVETLTLNGPEFISQYKDDATESEGDYPLYKQELDGVQVALQDAAHFMEYVYQLPKCYLLSCLEERVADLQLTISKIESQQSKIQQRFADLKCRNSSDEKFLETLNKTEELLAQAKNESVKKEQFAQAAENCRLLRALEIDSEINKNDSGLVELKEMRVHKERNESQVAQFEDLFAMWGTTNNKTVDGLHLFVQKSMTKKMKKAQQECSSLQNAFRHYSKKTTDLDNQLEGKLELKQQLQKELPHRPETTCSQVDKAEKELQKDLNELQKKKSDFEREIDKTRLEKLVETFYNQAKDNQKLNETRSFILNHFNSSEEVAEFLSLETDLNITQEIVKEVLTQEVVKGLEEATVENLENKIEDIKTHCKDIIEDLKKKAEAKEEVKVEEPKEEQKEETKKDKEEL